jgi:hypothetical protein
VTAANLFVRDRAAYLLTDWASYRPDGVVLALKPKVIEFPELRLAMMCSGETWETRTPIVKAWMERSANADAGVRSLPALASVLRADLADDYRRRGLSVPSGKEWPPQAYFDLYVAIWSAERHRPEGYAISSRGWHFPSIRELPGQLYQIERHIQPPYKDELAPDPYSPEFEPERDGLALLEAQRRYVNHYSGHIVGGAAQLTIVSEEGVSSMMLREWPDGIGRRIEPSRDNERELKLAVPDRTLGG